jgi:hypothetical protein
VAQEVGNPLCVLHVGLAAWHVLDVVRIGDDQDERAMQQVVHRPPIDAGAFHRDMSHALVPEPVVQRFKILRHRGESAYLATRLPISLCDDRARDN